MPELKFSLRSAAKVTPDFGRGRGTLNTSIKLSLNANTSTKARILVLISMPMYTWELFVKLPNKTENDYVRTVIKLWRCGRTSGFGTVRRKR